MSVRLRLSYSLVIPRDARRVPCANVTQWVAWTLSASSQTIAAKHCNSSAICLSSVAFAYCDKTAVHGMYMASRGFVTRSQHIWQQQNVARQLINLWLTVISSLFDRVAADRHTYDVWQQQLSIAYRHEQTCHDLIILSLPARFYVSQDSSCYVKPIAVLHLTVDGCTSHINYMHLQLQLSTIGSSYPEVISRHI